jgi:hypothetical protein
MNLFINDQGLLFFAFYGFFLFNYHIGRFCGKMMLSAITLPKVDESSNFEFSLDGPDLDQSDPEESESESEKSDPRDLDYVIKPQRKYFLRKKKT